MEVSDHPNKILYVITKATWGGAQRYVCDLALQAHSRGWEVQVAYGTSGELGTRLETQNIPTIAVPGMARDISFSSDIASLRYLIDLMKRTQPHIVHANSSKAGLLACIAARIARVPTIVFTAHGWAFNESRPQIQKVLFALFHLLTVWAADRVICVSKAVQRDMHWMPFSRRKSVVIHNGIAPIELVSKTTAREKLSVPTTLPLWIGTLAELHPTKGLDIAVRAFAQIAREIPETMLVLIGEGQDRARLTSLVSQLALQDRVYFCGNVIHAASLLPAFDIFLFPSRSEALGYVALEAGSAGVPVVASTVGGIPEIIHTGTSGILFPVGDVDACAEALKKLIQSPELRHHLGETLKKEVADHFSISEMIQRTFTVYTI